MKRMDGMLKIPRLRLFQMRIKIPFGLNSYQSRSLPVNNQELVNLYAERQPVDSKDTIVTHGFPGTTLKVTVGNGPIHGLKVMNDVLYAVSGTSLYSIIGSTATLIGTYPGNVRTVMEHNGSELIMVNGLNGYLYDTANGLRAITDTDFNQLSYQAAYLERRFLLPTPNSKQFYCSDAFDGFNYNGLNFDQILVDQENINGLVADHGELWVFSKKGAEVWVYNRDESIFPFSRIDGAYIEKGLFAKHSITKLDNTFFWIGDDKVIYRTDGYKPTRISTHSIEKEIQSYSTITDAFGLSYEIEGHSFCEFTFPSGNKTWRYDASTNLWHEARYGTGRYHANAVEYFEDNVVLGDYQNGNIYILDYDTYTDNGATIHRIASTPQIHAGRTRATMDRLIIDIESGVGLTTGQGSDPKLMLKYSKDGGKTWSSEKWSSMGKIGEYSYRVKFDNIGMYYQVMFKLEISDPVKVTIIDAYADIEIDDSY